jgi:ATP-dependent RNA helicase DeaD
MARVDPDRMSPADGISGDPAGETAGDGFAALGLDPQLRAAIAALGYEEPTPIQREAIPPLLIGRDLLAEAPTGTGKTAAFALPTLQRIAMGQASGGRTSALVLVPTRELAMQVAEAFHQYGRRIGARVLPVYGGQPIGQQLRGLQRGVDVVVATPGRAVDHIRRGSLRLDQVRVLILDEADEMLDMGFADDLETILAATPSERQTALFSATVSPTITRIAKRHQRDPVRVKVHAEKASRGGVALVRQVAYVVRRTDKLAALCRVLDVEDPSAALVFGRTRGEVDDLAEALSTRGHDAGALHGGLSQVARDRIMTRFRDGALNVLVATDVAARGLDIERVSHVVNFDVPSNPDAYVHRVGRTGRAGREGAAITFVEPREHRLLRNIEAATHSRLEIAQLPTVADLRERGAEVLRANLREALLGDDYDRFRGVVEPLADEFDLVDIALAAVSLIKGPAGQDADEVELHAPALVAAPPARVRRPVGVRAVPGRSMPRAASAPGGPAGRGGPDGPWVRLFVGGGRRDGVRPGDLVRSATAPRPWRSGMRWLMPSSRPCERPPSAAAVSRSGASGRRSGPARIQATVVHATAVAAGVPVPASLDDHSRS